MGGAGNVIDEQIAKQVAPGPGSPDGVAIAGVNTAGGKVALGGGTGTGTGTGNGTGSGLGRGGTGPVDARFGDADGPQFEYREEPKYPYSARRLHKEGKVMLMLFIDERGRLEKVDVVEATDQTFVSSAVEAMKKSKFRPARPKGVPYPCRAPYVIHFGF